MMRSFRWGWLPVLPLLANGCLSESNYLMKRTRDFGDVVDVKYGWGLGLGVKAEATPLIGPGLGFGGRDVREKWGRETRMTGRYQGLFLHTILFGIDSDGPQYLTLSPTTFSGNFAATDVEQHPLSWIRFGGETLLPGATGGLYLNVGEFFDFVAGVFTFDLVGDDYGPPRHPQSLYSPEPAQDESVDSRNE